MSERGVPVFNAPGANANAVKELVIAGLLIAARNLAPALRFVDGLRGDDASMDKQVEEGKKHFAGHELPHARWASSGSAGWVRSSPDAAIRLGMNVLGYDPEITVEAAWSLPSQVRKAHSVEEVAAISGVRDLACSADARNAAPGQCRAPQTDEAERHAAQFLT
jgi:D-3-phosphoglycerate dehydrogenase